MRELLRRLFPGLAAYRHGRKILGANRPAHFRPLASLLAAPPAPLQDRPAAEIDSINRSSRAYFEAAEKRDYWLNRPYSDPETAPWSLWRFGLLLSALRLARTDRVLDFGCGTGWTSIMMARMGVEVLGMDIAPEALAIARDAARQLPPALASRLRFQEYSGGGIGEADRSFDAVVVFDAFHHFPNPSQLLREFCRLLGPYGQFGFSEPGIGHAAAEHSQAEGESGVLEQDVDLEQLHRSGLDAGFADLDLVIPGVDPRVLTLPMRRARRFLRGRSWLLPADFTRAAILTAPIGVFRKSPLAVTSLRPVEVRARIQPASATVSARPGQPFELAVDVSNPTETVWLTDGHRGVGRVRLGAHLLDAEGSVLVQDYGRAELPGPLSRNRGAQLRLPLRAPEAAGSYCIQLDMVAEEVCWFAWHGSPTAGVALQVLAG